MNHTLDALIRGLCASLLLAALCMGAMSCGDDTATASGNDAPGNNAPGNNAPGNNAPGNNAPGNNAPGNNAPGNNTPGNNNTGDPNCLSDEDLFVTRVWLPLVSSTCIGCHVSGGVADQTRMVLLAGQDEASVAHNLDAVRAVSALDEGGLPLFVVKPAGLHPSGHGGGELLDLNSGVARDMIALAARMRGEEPDCDEDNPEAACDPSPGRRVLRRLSHEEYEKTIKDLLGVGLEAADVLAPDDVVHGFDNQVDALNVAPFLADQYRDFAERAGTAVDISAMVPCGLVSGDQACARKFIARFGLRAFRRPLTVEDKARYLAIFDTVSTEDSFEEGIRWVIIAMLQSPHFLYRSELGVREGEDFYLTPWEVAAELSYLFWGTMPDDELFEAAASGELTRAEGVAAQAQRLLEDPRSAETLERFAARWLQLDQLEIVTRDDELFPELTPQVREAMARETSIMLTTLWTDNATLADLFTIQTTYLNETLARFYGMTLDQDAPGGEEFIPVDLSETPYGGLLTQGSLLTVHALPTSSSPIHRGRLIRERFLCQELPEPPANLDTSPPPVDPSLSTRERYTQHAADPACSGCHDLIDPIGFAFEHFDAVGRWRDVDGMHAIDDAGAIINTLETNTSFEGVDGLSQVMAESPDVSRCYIEQWVRYGTSQAESLDLACVVSTLHDDFDGATPLNGALLALSRLDHFMMREGGAEEGDAAGAEILPARGEAVDLAALDPDLDTGGDEPFEPEEPEEPGDSVTFELTESTRWETGYCADVVLNNPTGQPVVWAITVQVEGTINNVWNATASGDSGRVRFTGAGWNDEIAPGAQLDFGFCSNF